MIDEPRTYRRSPLQFILVMVLLVIFAISFLTTIPRTGYTVLIPLAVFLGIAFVSTFYTMTQKTTISDDGISAQNFLGEKSLRWSEISRVSGRGYGIKLHNSDGDVTVAPGAQLPGYEEVVEWVGIKRPDLFNPLEYNEMKRGLGYIFGLAVLAMLFIFGLVVFVGQFINSADASMTFVLILLGILLFAILWMVLSFPQSLTLDGRSLTLKYIFSEKTLLIDEIASVDFRYSQTRNGKNYFIQITQTSKKKIRISGLNPSLPIVYLVLKNWHGKNAPIGLTIQRN